MTKGQERRSRGVLSDDVNVTSDKREQGFILYITQPGGRGEQ